MFKAQGFGAHGLGLDAGIEFRVRRHLGFEQTSAIT